MIGFVIGNGESRLDFNLEALRDLGKIYGCNKLFEDFNLDVLISVDKKMVDYINNSNYSGEFFFPDRKQDRIISKDGFHSFKFYNGDAGSEAISIMCQRIKNLKKVILIGFDIGWGEGQEINNVHKGSVHYELEKYKTFKPQRWILALRKVFILNKNIEFVRVVDPSRNYIVKFGNIKNYSEVTFAKFETIILDLRRGFENEKIYN